MSRFVRGELSVAEEAIKTEGEYAYKTREPLTANPYPFYPDYCYCRHNLWLAGWKMAYLEKCQGVWF
jgi:hypothetical protein